MMSSPQRSGRIYVRVSSQERAAIERRAAAAGLSMSDYLRRRALVDGDRPVISTDPETLKLLYRDLALAGSNFLNAALTRVGSAAEAVSSFLADARNV